MSQGDVAVAMALSFRLVYTGPTVDLAYTAVLFGVVVHELVSPRLLRGLLVDAGELREDLGPVPERS
jgi:NhaP-type Na+/H+ or K+/H+ antiporter